MGIPIPKKNAFHIETAQVISNHYHALIYFTLIMLCALLRPRQNGRHSADYILKCIFLNENVWIPIEISLNFVPKGPIDNIPALV